jgi:hypothetical protein
MANSKIAIDLPDEEQRAVFAALVAVQDESVGVVQSRKVIAERYGLTVEQVKELEERGLKGKWPPL